MVSENPTRNHFYLLRWLYLPYLYQQNILETQINCLQKRDDITYKDKRSMRIQRPKPKTTTGLGVSALYLHQSMQRKL